MPTQSAGASSVSMTRVPIVPRRMKLSFEGVTDRFFFENNSIISATLAALSAVFPPGEKEFIQSVRLFSDRITDEKLLEDIKLFSNQEGQHSALHRQFNDALDELGFGATRISEYVEEEISDLKETQTPEERLAITVVMEHVTACMAHFALTQPERFESVPEGVRELLFWHAVEEIEHKSVAFDVYEQTVGDRGRLRRTLFQQMVLFPLMIGRIQYVMLKEMGHRPTAAEHAAAGRFLFGRKGLIVGVMPHYLALLKPGFHPWDVDDSWLIERWKKGREAGS